MPLVYGNGLAIFSTSMWLCHTAEEPGQTQAKYLELAKVELEGQFAVVRIGDALGVPIVVSPTGYAGNSAIQSGAIGAMPKKSSTRSGKQASRTG
jgi:hypothetical protein